MNRTTFTVPTGSKNALLTFQGLNYRADIVVNGVMVANASTVAGAYRYFDFDVTKYITIGMPATLQVTVYPPNDQVCCSCLCWVVALFAAPVVVWCLQV